MTYEESIAAEIEDIRQKNFARIATAHKSWMIVEIDGQFEVHVHTPHGIAPSSAYNSKRAAAARLLQLLQTGPVAPQTWPEQVYIGSVSLAPDDGPAQGVPA